MRYLYFKGADPNILNYEDPPKIAFPENQRHITYQ